MDPAKYVRTPMLWYSVTRRVRVEMPEASMKLTPVKSNIRCWKGRRGSSLSIANVREGSEPLFVSNTSSPPTLFLPWTGGKSISLMHRHCLQLSSRLPGACPTEDLHITCCKLPACFLQLQWSYLFTQPLQKGLANRRDPCQGRNNTSSLACR